MKYLVVSTLLTALLASCGGDAEIKKDEFKEDTTAKVQPRKTGELKIAFYSQDSMAIHFTTYRVADSLVQRDQLTFEREVQRRETEYVNWAQRKDGEAQKGLLTENDMARLQQEAQRRQAQLAEYQQKRGMEIQQKLAKEMDALMKKINQFSTEYCEANNIDILIKRGTGGQFGYVHSTMDVTAEFIAYMNQAQEKLISGK